jgi:hypothetical protein
MDRPAVTPPLRSGREWRPHRPRSVRSGLGCERLERRDCPAGLFTIEPPAGPIIEGDRATFTVRLAAPSSQPERVLVSTVAETATLGRDYTFQNSQQLLFAPGTTTRQFTINTLSDTLREGVETLRIVVSPMNRPGALPVTTRAAIYDLVPTTVSVGDIRVTEGNEGTTNADFVVRLTAGAILPVTLNYATRNGTATAGTDYTATTGTLTFAPGEFEKTVSVPILGDRIAETDETFQLVLSNPSRGTTLRTPQATCTIVNDEQDQLGFQITVEYVTSFFGEVPPNVRAATQQAVQRWQQVITGDLPGFIEVSTGTFVDDFRMRVQMGLLGEPDGTDPLTLANARPLQYRPDGGLPWLGETGIDTADVNDPQLVNILIHEIGHALGFASSNPGFVRWVSGSAWTGPNAVREYRTLAGSSVTLVPLETEGGPGTAGAHWSEAVFRTELMTGRVEAAGVPMPLSPITVGAFADLGYTVNYAAADAYSLPTTPPPLTSGQTAALPTPIPVQSTAKPPVAKTVGGIAAASPPIVTPAAGPQKTATSLPQATPRPATPPRPKAPAPVSAGGVAAAFSTLGRLR